MDGIESAVSADVRGKMLEPAQSILQRLQMKDPFRHFKTSPEIIRLAVMGLPSRY
jgi:hypothetical protein